MSDDLHTAWRGAGGEGPGGVRGDIIQQWGRELMAWRRPCCVWVLTLAARRTESLAVDVNYQEDRGREEGWRPQLHTSLHSIALYMRTGRKEARGRRNHKC